MGRKSTLDEAAVFRFVGATLAKAGAVTLQGVVEGTGFSMGSLYHRYRSREGLLAHTWLDALEAFQNQFAALIEHGGVEAGARAAALTPVFCRQHPARGVVLACCRASEFVGDKTPPALRERIDLANRRGAGALKRFSQRTQVDLITCQLAVVGMPLGAVRLFLPAQPVPLALDERVQTAYQALMQSP
ncbi:MAG: hypothetical protein AAGA68_00200 [Pseudomonadota bacterium]